MKCKIPEISWHNRDPVLSVDIQPNKSNGAPLKNYRLASGGTDAHVLIWYMKVKSGEKVDIELDLAADLTRHQRAVNVVKWSPNGELLASGDDESVVFIWKLKPDSEPLNIVEATNEQDKEVWITLKILRGHMEDIYDLSWAPNSLFLVTGSVDNSAMMWDITKGKSTAILNDHKGFVQGVAWDPKNQYIATLSTDRHLRIFDIQSKKVLHRVRKATLPVAKDHALHGKNIRLFHDDTLQTFFRRLCFSPDGKLLLTPSGVTDYDGCVHPLNTTYAFSRYGFRQPAIVLPCPDQYTVAVRCCPLLYKLRPYNEEKNTPVVPLPYRMVFAVATKSSVYFYDTQQKQPFALISNIHYTRLTDITWSHDGLVVVVSSTDGFCSLITFEKGELGEIYEDTDAVLEAALAQVNAKNGKMKKQKENDSGSKLRKPSLDCSSHTKESAPMQKEKNTTGKINDVEMKSVAADNLKKDGKESSLGGKSIKTPDIFNAKPIAIQENPGENSKETEDYMDTLPSTSKRTSRASIGKVEKKATPIAIKRKPGNAPKNENSPVPTVEKEQKENQCTPPKAEKLSMPSKVLKGDIVLDKEILGSGEKFESPEKKSRPATPISVRRHPRTPSHTPTQASQNSPTTFSKTINSQVDQSPSCSKEIGTPRQHKKANPIAIRRTPRNKLILPSVVNTPTLVEEAMDAWPVAKATEPADAETDKDINKLKEIGVLPLPSEDISDRTEDIRLVYEDTVEEEPTTTSKSTRRSISSESSAKQSTSAVNSSEKAKPLETPGNKRRVALKTISTTKSKSKTLD